MSNNAAERNGHRRQPALGKSMPVTALLLNLPQPPSHGRQRHARGDEDELPPRYFSIFDEAEQQPPNDGNDNGQPSNPHYAEQQLRGNGQSQVPPCLLCTQAAPAHLAAQATAINEMCERLCTADCRRQLSLAGYAGERKDFREKYEIAEALAKTSAMTSTAQIKQRLAARKLELAGCNNNGDSSNDNDDNVDTDDEQARLGVVGDRLNIAAAVGDMLPPPAASPLPLPLDYEPPRDLLLYLVRMGSFNSAPKINNVDSQDDGLELPKGLSTTALLQHVQELRGGNQPPLLTRYFLNPFTPMLIGEDVTDGLRCLKLNAVSRVCSAPVSQASHHIRLLQWNILSQTLGQNNDGFVRCPDEALTWQHRKYLIVQEILQNQPDVICLQEVDHFKFLQTVLGCQNYEGIFYPKPDSPCLYIEENNGPDGCAIFYKRDKFNLLNYDTRILEVWRVQSNQVAIAVRLQVKDSGREFCVCTTHLKARHGALLAKLRNEQGRDLIRFVKQFAGESPVLMCGDFNAEPVEPIYATILSCDILKLSSAYADMKMEQPQEEQPNCEDSLLNDVNELVAQSIKREPPYTTWKIREEGEECHTIDYVFYTPKQLKIKNCLEFPAGEVIGKNRTPSFQYPSDHFSLVCDFELLDTLETENTTTTTTTHGNIQ